MKPEKPRIAIAEACGLPKPYSMCFGKVPNTLCHSVMVTNGVKHGMPIPDYLHDLNAMHEAEKVLTDKQWDTYCYRLDEVGGMRHCTHTTANQRAETFLRTLSLWQETSTPTKPQ